MVSKTRTYNWFIAMVAASCMTLYGFDSSVFNVRKAKPFPKHDSSPAPKNVHG